MVVHDYRRWGKEVKKGGEGLVMFGSKDTGEFKEDGSGGINLSQ